MKTDKKNTTKFVVRLSISLIIGMLFYGVGVQAQMDCGRIAPNSANYPNEHLRDLIGLTVSGNQVSFTIPANKIAIDAACFNPDLTGGMELFITNVEVFLDPGSAFEVGLDCGSCSFSSGQTSTVAVNGIGTYKLVFQCSGHTANLYSGSPQPFPGGNIWGKEMSSFSFNTNALQAGSVGLQSIDFEPLQVTKYYPNPFSHSTFIEVNSPKNTSLSFQTYDFTGRLVETKDVKLHHGANLIEYGLDLQSGIYTVVAVSEKSQYSLRIIKE